MTTDNKVQHTPGEMELMDAIDGYTDIIVDTLIIATVSTLSDQEENEAESKANAEHIVRCWNNHYALLEEIEKLKKQNEKMNNALYEIRHKIYTLDADEIMNIIMKAY